VKYSLYSAKQHEFKSHKGYTLVKKSDIFTTAVYTPFLPPVFAGVAEGRFTVKHRIAETAVSSLCMKGLPIRVLWMITRKPTYPRDGGKTAKIRY
jgi:hypothetical protein